MGEPPRSLDQPPPPLLIAPLHQHLIECMNGLHDLLHAPRHLNLGDLDTMIVTTGSYVDQRELRLQQLTGTELEARQGSKFAGFGRVPAVLLGVGVSAWRPGPGRSTM